MKKYSTYDVVDVKWDSAETLVNKINECFAKYGKENVSFEVEIEKDYDSDRAIAYLSCRREMTDKEREKQIAYEQKIEKKREEYERRQYEALQKKFRNNAN